MICKCRRILCFYFLFLFSVFFPFFSIYLQNQKIDKKIWAYPRWKAVYLVISCQYIFIVLSFFSLGMLWWTAVNLYSSCKLIVRKLYRFLYFGRKVFFFSVIKDFLSWHHIHCELCHYLHSFLNYSVTLQLKAHINNQILSCFIVAFDSILERQALLTSHKLSKLMLTHWVPDRNLTS